MMRLILVSIVIIITGFVGIAQNMQEKYLEAFANYKNGKYADASEGFSLLLEKNTEDSKLLFYKALTLFQQKKYNEAVIYLGKVNKEEIRERNLWLAKSYALMNNKDKSFHALTEYLSENDFIEKEKITSDNAFNNLKEDNRWFELWQNDWGNESNRILENARYYKNRNNFDRAIQVLEGNDIQDEEISIEKAQIYYETGKYALAVSELGRKKEYQNSVRVNDILSKSYVNLGENQKALKSVNTVIENQPEDFEAYKQRASINYELKNYYDAEKDINMLRRYFDNDPELDVLAAKVYRETGKGTTSLKILNRLLEKDESQAVYFIERAKTFAGTSNHKLAEEDFSMALDLDPTNGEVYYLKGLERIKMGDREGACTDFHKARLYGEMRAVKELLENGCE